MEIKKIIEYSIASHDNLTDLSKEVNAMIKDGWHPIGGVAAFEFHTALPKPDNSAIRFLQAMIKYES